VGRLRIVAAAMCILVGARAVTATIIYGVRAPDELIVGTDSAATGKNGIIPQRVCKLRQLDRDAVFAVYGLTGARADDGSIFVIQDFITSVFPNVGGGERLPWIDRALAKKLAAIARKDPWFRNEFPPGTTITHVMYFRVDPRGRTRLRTTGFDVTEGKRPRRITIRVEANCPPKCPPGEVVRSGGGTCFERISNQRALIEPGPGQDTLTADWVRTVIRRAILATPTECAGPIQVVRLTSKQGVEWIDGGTECGGY
jgi:hypothetical protein